MHSFPEAESGNLLLSWSPRKWNLLWNRNILQQNRTPTKTRDSELQNAQVWISYAVYFCKHLQVIVPWLGCSSSKRLTRNWTVAAIVFFLWRAPPGLSSLRPDGSHCSEWWLTPSHLSLCTFTPLPQSAFRAFAGLGFSSLLCLVRCVSEGADEAAVHIFWAAACSSVLSHKHMNPWHDLEHTMHKAHNPSSAGVPWVSGNICSEQWPSEQREYNSTNPFMAN